MSTVRSIARALLAARQADCGPIAFPGPVPSSLSEAYAIQDEVIAATGNRVIGWKVARLPASLAAEMGQGGIVGPIFACQSDTGPAAAGVGVFPGGYSAGEAEYLLRLNEMLPSPDGPSSGEEAALAIGSVHVGIEVASSPVAEIGRLGAPAVASDLGINSGIIVGPQIRDWRRAGVEGWRVSTELDGAAAGSGQASSFADGLAGSILILLDALSGRGHRLSAGQWVASGAVTGAHPLSIGQTMRVDFGGRLELSYAATPVVTLASAPPEHQRCSSKER